MKLRHIVPLASLAVLGVVLITGAIHDAPLGMEFTVPPADAGLPEVDLGLGDHVLRGLLVDEEGRPVADAGITTEQAGRPLWTWTERDGSFTLEELRPGPLVLRVVALHFEAVQFRVIVEGLPGGEPPITLTLDRPIGAPPQPPALVLGDLTGSVSWGPLAEPELGYELLFQPTTAPTDAAGGFPRRVRVAKDGTFAVDLLHAGRYRVILLSPEDRGARGPDLLERADGVPRTMNHETGGDTPPLKLVATMGGATGRVVRSPAADAGSVQGIDDPPAPTPIRGALIKVERLGESLASAEAWRGMSARSDEDGSKRGDEPGKVSFRAVRSDENGEFRLRDLSPGRYRLTLVAGRERRTLDLTVPEREVVTVNVDLSSR